MKKWIKNFDGKFIQDVISSFIASTISTIFLSIIGSIFAFFLSDTHWNILFVKVIVIAIATAIIITIILLGLRHWISRKKYITDRRDGQKYEKIKIGNQWWLAQNLNYAGDNKNKIGESYENNPENDKKYGRLYDWETAKNICPKGWHLPTKEEWQTLINFAGGNDIAGKKLKAVSGWNGSIDSNIPCDGTDEFGFSALPGGLFNHNDGGFINLGYKGVWWSSTEINSDEVYSKGIDNSGNYVFQGTEKKTYKLPIRCIED